MPPGMAVAKRKQTNHFVGAPQSRPSWRRSVDRGGKQLRVGGSDPTGADTRVFGADDPASGYPIEGAGRFPSINAHRPLQNSNSLLFATWMPDSAIMAVEVWISFSIFTAIDPTTK